MTKKFLSLAFIASAMLVCFSCNKSEEPVVEDQQEEEQQTPEEKLLGEIDENFKSVISTKWVFAGFEPSDDMVAAKADNDVAFAAIVYPEGAAKYFSPITLSFTEKDGVITPSVELTYEEAELTATLFKYENHIYNGMLDEFGMTEPLNTKESDFAQIRRNVASCFAADALKTDDISDSETGELIFTFEQNDLSDLEYDDIVLQQKVLIDGNNDKIYIDEDGSLVVETTSEAFGVSKYRYTAAE